MDINQIVGTAILNVTPLTVVLNLFIGFVLSLAIAWTYKKTHSGLSYSQNFVVMLIMLAILTTATMMIVGSNIVRAFTLLGAFTIIRFRTAIKDTRDIAFVFWALITGMAVGTANYLVAAILTVMLIIVVFSLIKSKFGSIRGFDYILNFVIPSGYNRERIDDVFGKYLKSVSVLNVSSRDRGEQIEYTYSIKFGNDKDVPDFIKELGSLSELKDVNVISSKDDIEY